MGVPALPPSPILGFDLDGGAPPPTLGSDLDGAGIHPAPLPPTPVLGSDLDGGGGTHLTPPPNLDLGRGYPFHQLDNGTLPPPCNGGQSEKITFRHPSDAGGKKKKC